MHADSSWPRQRLEEIAQIQTGIAKGKEVPAGSIQLPYLRVANVQDGYVDLREIKTLIIDPRQVERFLLRHGDVLFTEGGDADKLGRGCVWRGQIEPCLHQNHVFAVRADTKRLLPEFLSIYSSSPIGKNYFLDCAKQTTNLASINSSQLKAFPIAVPPIGEQQKIVAILYSVDEAMQTTLAVIDQLGAVKKALMAELLTRGIPGRHTKFKQTEIGEIPEQWQVVRAGDVCEIITKGATPVTQTRAAGEIPFLKVYNIDPRGFLDFSYQPTFIPQSVHKSELSRSRTFPNDVLMNIVGPPLGKVAVVPSDFPECNINQAIAVFRPIGVEAEFLAACLTAPELFAWARTRAKRTSTQLNLTLQLCRDYPMPLPSSPERAQILSLLNSTTKRTHAESDYLDALRKTKSALMSALLTGELRVTPDEQST